MLQFRRPGRGVREDQTGEEEFVFNGVGALVFRQVLAWPEVGEPLEEPSSSLSTPPILERQPQRPAPSVARNASRKRRTPVIPVVIGLVMVGIIAAVGAVFSMSGSDSDSLPNAVVSPTETPARTDAPAAPTGTALTNPAATPSPVEPTPTLTLNEVFELPEKEAAKEIERQQLTESTPTPSPMQEEMLVSRWGTPGEGEGQFNNPSGIAVSPDGSVYVTETGGSRIQKFTSEGKFITQWGKFGQLDGEFIGLSGIAVAPDGSVYVADKDNPRIQKFTSDGVFVRKFGGWEADEESTVASPSGIAVASNGSVYVTEAFNTCRNAACSNANHIKKFTSEGKFITAWGKHGEGDGEVRLALYVAVAPDGSVYVSDNGNQRIQKFTSNGVFVSNWGTWKGASDRQVENPWGIAVASDGSVYVSDQSNARIQKFTSDGMLISKWSTCCSVQFEFDFPSGVAVSHDGSVYVADHKYDRIQKFSVEQ